MKRNDALYLGIVAILAVLLISMTLSRGHEAVAGFGKDAARGTAGAGEARDVDMRQLERLIKERRLSGREALHYRRIE